MQWKPNTTVAAVIEQQGRFLLVEENDNGNTVFNQPAGHLEANETLIEAVQREVLEETAREFEPEFLIGIYLYPHPQKSQLSYLRFCFYGQCQDQQQNRSLDSDIIRTIWLRPEELDASRMRSPMVQQCIKDYLAGKKYPLELLKHYP